MNKLPLLHLQKVTRDETKPTPVVDSRNDLLKQIRDGIELKPVSPETRTSQPVNITVDEGLAGALHRALLKRKEELQSSGSEDSTSNTSDDEWND